MAGGSGGRYLAPDIDEALVSGQFHAWLALDGTAIHCVLVTCIARYPRLTALRIVGLVGQQPRRWLHLLSEVADWARAMGCDRMEALHPVHYCRILARAGFREFHRLSEMGL